VILGVSVDSVASHKSFCATEGLHFRLLADTDGKVSSKYGSLRAERGMSLRNTFIIDPEGKIAHVFTGVNPTAHSSEVLAMLAQLQGG
jgi:peroxiredoxin Q/BCP